MSPSYSPHTHKPTRTRWQSHKCLLDTEWDKYINGTTFHCDPEYLAPSDAEAPIEDQPSPDDASPTTLSPGYVADSDSEEDPADYPADRGDDADDESLDDDDDDDNYDEQEASEDDDEEEEHLWSTLLLRRTARMSVRPQIPMSDTTEALIAEYTSAPTPPSPPLMCHCCTRSVVDSWLMEGELDLEGLPWTLLAYL
ncbi:hypothetical protein Tco_0769328 [Tanacetum coccineum]|uniref:Uncharacterized protein n=1 Tax=Tanacetum coccineum TaxID=301880 RepID=A0ABQ4ZC05_9ASTR